MRSGIVLQEKYERNGWPSMPRPDLKPPDGWSLSLITAVNRPRNHRLSPDGSRIAFIWDREDLSDVYLMPSSGGWPRRISTTRPPVAYWDDEVPRWSPDGRWLAFTMDRRVYIVPAEGGLPRQISSFSNEAYASAWMPDNFHLLIMVERDETVQLLLTDREGNWPRPLVTEAGDVREAVPSPDGKLVAYTFDPRGDPNRRDVRLVDLETGQTRLLAGAPRQKDFWPRWSPDGSTLMFLSGRTGFDEIWLVRPDGEGLRRLTHLEADISEPSWSPDGRRIAVTINRGGVYDLAIVDVDSGQSADLKRGRGIYSRPQWAPDGSFLTVEFESPVQPCDLFRIELPGGRQTQLTFSMLPALECLTLIMPEAVTYRSKDKIEIPALLFRPQHPNGAAVVYPHGGPSSQYCYEWDILTQYLLAKGYTFLMPNYRGSTGFGLKFEQLNYGQWGQGDVQDCLTGARFLAALDEVIPERIAIYGASYGGYLVACCLARDPEYLFACGISKFGDAHLETSWALCSRELRYYTEKMIGHPAKNRDVYYEGSPIYQVENIQSPVLILHGLEDDIVPPEASEDWVEALRHEDKTFEYKTYAGESHGFLKRATQMDAYARIERFLDWYLMPMPRE
jgi:dipeptidyl aminopeptidase/acylaminoacyl peptidase